MKPTMIPDNQHKDIPVNPSIAKSSNILLRQTATEDSMRVLTVEDWKFWKHNGYIIIKQAVSRKQALETAAFLCEFEEKDPNDPTTWYTPPRAEMQMKKLAET